MKLLSDKRFYKFLIPSLIGAFLFVTPVNQDGNLTIPIAVVANMLLDFMGDSALTVIWVLINLSGIITIVHKFIGIGILKSNPKLNNLFSVKGFWFAVRLTGLVFANMIYFDIGPDFIIGGATGARYPEQLLELASAVDYVKKNAENFRVNADMVYAVGASAGGHLVGSLAVTQHRMDEIAHTPLNCKLTG